MAVSFNQSVHYIDTFLHVDARKNDSWDLRASFYSTAAWAKCGFQVWGADTKRYIRQLKIGRSSMICGPLLTSVFQNFDVLSTFCGRKYIRLDVHPNT